ncbi:PEP-CTERM motif protein [Opitutaceae bacterium TAV1]|nr:PEP-CTERM motif protein [Opitutaceae bacterium TAV1]
MKNNINSCSIFRAFGAALCFLIPLAGLPAATTALTYDFESLQLENLGSQDSWTRPSGGHPVVLMGTGTNTSKVVAATSNGDFYAWRPFDLPYAATQNDAVFQVDMQWQKGTTGYSRSLLFGGYRTTEETNLQAFSVGLYSAGNTQQFYLGVNNASGTFDYSAFKSNVPSSITDTSWLSLRLVFDFAANEGNGSVTLLYKDLSSASSVWTEAGASTTNVNLNLKAISVTAAANPANWNYLSMRLNNTDGTLDTAIALDNIYASATSTIPEPATQAVLLGSAMIAMFFICRRR